MKIKINFPTGNWFNDGTFEVGKVLEEEVFTRKDLDDILDEIPEGTEYFITDADGNTLDIYEFYNQLINREILHGMETTMKTYNISTTNANIKVTEEDIEDIMCTALEGGINYWCHYDRNDEEYLPYMESGDEPFSELCTKILLSGGLVWLIDADYHFLTLDKLLTGIQRWIDGGYDMYGAVDGDELDCGNIDSECADCIIQLALFGEIVYG